MSGGPRSVKTANVLLVDDNPHVTQDGDQALAFLNRRGSAP